MKVLMGAYACAPYWGSEPGAGWIWSEAASQAHEVWILTADEYRPYIESCMDKFPVLRERLHPVYVDVRVFNRWRFPSGGSLRFLHYVLWQYVARRVARQLHGEVRFDIAHHLTMTVSWLPSALAGIRDIPLVWGPVSGAVGVPTSLWRWLGWRGALREVARQGVIPALRAVFARVPLRRAAIVLAQSEDFARWARPRANGRVIVEPVIAIHELHQLQLAEAGACSEHKERLAVFAARLEPWKGLRLVLGALARPEARGWRLDVYGSGRSEERAAKRLARRLGIGERVRFLGHVSRGELGEAIASAAVFLHPSFHDAPPFVVAEALCAGCPVLCLDVGGPVALVSAREAVVVPVGRDPAGSLAKALNAAPPRFETSTRWLVGRLPRAIDAWYKEAISSR